MRTCPACGHEGVKDHATICRYCRASIPALIAHRQQQVGDLTKKDNGPALMWFIGAVLLLIGLLMAFKG